MKVVLAANDYGESTCLTSIAKEFRSRGHTTEELLGFGRLEFTEELARKAAGCDVLVVAISTVNDTIVELAKRAKIPVVVYAPAPRAYEIEDAEPLREVANILLLGREDELNKAAKLYPKSKPVAAVGHIMHEEYYPAMSVGEARDKADVRPDEKLIFVPGDHEIGTNWPLFHSVVEAAHRKTVLCCNPVIAIGLHPGKTKKQEDADYATEIYQDLVRNSRRVPVKLYIKQNHRSDFLHTLPSTTLVTASDLVISTGSSVTLNAAYQRKPVIMFYFETFLAQVEKESPFVWELEKNFSADVVRDGSIDELAETMARLLTPAGYANMKMFQEKHYPEPTVPGSTAKKAVDEILNVLD